MWLFSEASGINRNTAGTGNPIAHMNLSVHIAEDDEVQYIVTIPVLESLNRDNINEPNTLQMTVTFVQNAKTNLQNNRTT